MPASDILVAGDVHGEFGKLNAWVNHKRPAIVLQCGDFGYWPRSVSKQERKRRTRQVPKMGNAKLCWCDGNHEDFWALRDRERDEVYPNVFYMPRGSTLELPDGRVVLFVGGAESHDKQYRLDHEAVCGEKIWFAEERITQQDVHELPETRVDIIISHAAPREFEVFGGGWDLRKYDPSRLALSAVLHRYKEHEPLWFFAHYHARITGTYRGVRYLGLNMIGCPEWWTRLPERGDQ